MTRTWTTWRRQDGEEMAGEFAFVGDAEFLDDEVYDADEPVAFVRETWELVTEVIEWRFPTLYSCSCSCDEDADGWYRTAAGTWFAACGRCGDLYGTGPGVQP